MVGKRFEDIYYESSLELLSKSSTIHNIILEIIFETIKIFFPRTKTCTNTLGRGDHKKN